MRNLHAPVHWTLFNCSTVQDGFFFVSVDNPFHFSGKHWPVTGVFLLFTEVPYSLNSFRCTGSASHQMYLTAPLQNVTHYEHPRRLLFIQPPDPHQYDHSPKFWKKQDIFQLECMYITWWKVSNYSLFNFAGSSLLVNTIISCSVLLKLLCLVSGCHCKAMQGKI